MLAGSSRILLMIFPRGFNFVGSCIAISYGKNRQATKTDYPSVNFRGARWPAHRLSFSLNIKKIERSPESRTSGLILHTCDNKWCINPEHLYLGTAKQNVVDTFTRHSTIRQKLSAAAKANLTITKNRMDWTGKKAKETTKRKISEKAKARYSMMTAIQRRAHMRPALEKRHNGGY